MYSTKNLNETEKTNVRYHMYTLGKKYKNRFLFEKGISKEICTDISLTGFNFTVEVEGLRIVGFSFNLFKNVIGFRMKFDLCGFDRFFDNHFLLHMEPLLKYEFNKTLKLIVQKDKESEFRKFKTVASDLNLSFNKPAFKEGWKFAHIEGF